MPELRKDPVVGRWVIISTERAFRPFALPTGPSVEGRTPTQADRLQSFCPLCPGRESMTPGEVLTYRRDGEWTLRVVPNKFPVLRVEGGVDRSGEGMYDRMNGLGAHEVVIEHPRHDLRFGALSVGEISQVARAWRARISDLRRDFRLRYVLVYRNEAASNSGLVTHPQSQLIALPILPRRVADELAGAQRYFDFKERCVFCDMVRQELNDARRLVYENHDFVVFEPFAARFPFETWVLPKRHSASFQDADDGLLEQLAQAMKVALYKLDRALEEPAYSFILHNAPFNQDKAEHYHWHIEIMPALTRVTGFEWGSGFYINPTPPEESARYMREEIPLGL